MRFIRHIVGMLVALAVALGVSVSVATPSQALNMAEARSALPGGCLHNLKTDALVCIIGTHKVTRLVTIGGNQRNKNFYLLKISMQRCDNGECYGPAKEGTLKPRKGLPGKPADSKFAASTEDMADGDNVLDTQTSLVESAKAVANVCFLNTTVCAAPWDWVGSSITERQQGIEQYFIYPCASGAIGGFGGGMGVNLAADSFLDSGLLTRTEASGLYSGPLKLGALGYGGCMAGMAFGGSNLIKDWYNAMRN